jgi:hypothetical protein
MALPGLGGLASLLRSYAVTGFDSLARTKGVVTLRPYLPHGTVVLHAEASPDSKPSAKTAGVR